jgi:hypothetical protein
VLHRLVDQVHAADHIGLVVEPTNEVAEPCRLVACQVVNEAKPVLLEQARDQRRVVDAAVHEFHALRHVRPKTCRQVVQSNYMET